jgi:hypothetical protein
VQHVRAAYCLLRLGRPDEALVTLDAGKARLMEEAFALTSPARGADASQHARVGDARGRRSRAGG